MSIDVAFSSHRIYTQVQMNTKTSLTAVKSIKKKTCDSQSTVSNRWKLISDAVSFPSLYVLWSMLRMSSCNYSVYNSKMSWLELSLLTLKRGFKVIGMIQFSALHSETVSNCIEHAVSFSIHLLLLLLLLLHSASIFQYHLSLRATKRWQ